VGVTAHGNILTIKVDQEYGPSSSGKTLIIASAHGNVSAADRQEVKVGRNVDKEP
jgi:RecA/RadA recombinase